MFAVRRPGGRRHRHGPCVSVVCRTHATHCLICKVETLAAKHTKATSCGDRSRHRSTASHAQHVTSRYECRDGQGGATPRAHAAVTSGSEISQPQAEKRVSQGELAAVGAAAGRPLSHCSSSAAALRAACGSLCAIRRWQGCMGGGAVWVAVRSMMYDGHRGARRGPSHAKHVFLR